MLMSDNKDSDLQVISKWALPIILVPYMYALVCVKKKKKDGIPRSNEFGWYWIENVNHVSLMLKFYPLIF